MATPSHHDIGSLSDVIFLELTDAIIEFLTGANKGQWLQSRTKELSTKHGVSEDVIRNITKSLISLGLNSVKRKQSKGQLLSNLNNLGISDANAKSFFQKLEASRSNITKTLSTSSLSINRLVDMEWKFGVTAASSESNKVGNTFLQLKLVINNGDQLNNVYMELSLSQFYAFLHEMEKVKTSMDYFN